jgi:hypothetical protein
LIFRSNPAIRYRGLESAAQIRLFWPRRAAIGNPLSD